MNNIKKITFTDQKIVILISFFISLFAFFYFLHRGELISFGDAASRLDISRKIIDSLTPGVGQFGDIWLPLPQILMLPLIWNDYLWHSGIAGSIMSGISFVLLMFFIYQTAFLITGKKIGATIAAVVVATNINVLFMQVTAMSEILFISMVAGGLYFLTRWCYQKNDQNLIFAGLFISAASFTRYEGYALVLTSILFVGLFTYFTFRNLRKTEGKVILFSTISLTGIFVWAGYLGLIFGNPFIWKDIYSHQASIISTDVVNKQTLADQGTVIPQQGHLLSAIVSYWISTAYMNGVLITILASIAFIIFGIYLLKNKQFSKKPQLFILFIPLSLYAFVVYSLYRGSIPLEQPSFNLATLLGTLGNNLYEYNIRYGIDMVPFIALILGWLSSKSKLFTSLVVAVASFQILALHFTKTLPIFSLPREYSISASGMSAAETQSTLWFKSNYDGGLIMISALKHDPVMFNMGIKYKNFIQEGAGKYWISSRISPEKYATWIYMYKLDSKGGAASDSVTKYVSNNPILNTRYKVAYQNSEIIIYKIIDAPDVVGIL